MKIKGILFDKDGTLIDFYEVWGPAVKPVIEELVKMYHFVDNEQLVEDILKNIGVENDVINPEGSFAWKPYELIAKDIIKVLQIYSKQEYDVDQIREQLASLFYQKITLERIDYPSFTNLSNLMKQLNDLKIKTGIATTDEYKATVECMKKIGIDDRITFYGTAGADMPIKPDKLLLENAALQWGIKTEQIAVVGDTPNDMRFAKQAGAIAIAVLSGTGKREDLEHTADYVIDSVDGLLSLIHSIEE